MQWSNSNFEKKKSMLDETSMKKTRFICFSVQIFNKVPYYSYDEILTMCYDHEHCFKLTPNTVGGSNGATDKKCLNSYM